MEMCTLVMPKFLTCDLNTWNISMLKKNVVQFQKKTEDN